MTGLPAAWRLKSSLRAAPCIGRAMAASYAGPLVVKSEAHDHLARNGGCSRPSAADSAGKVVALVIGTSPIEPGQQVWVDWSVAGRGGPL